MVIGQDISWGRVTIYVMICVGVLEHLLRSYSYEVIYIIFVILVQLASS